MEKEREIAVQKINETAKKILKNINDLDDIAKNKSYEIPAEEELEQIRRNFDDLQLDNKDFAMKELVRWMKLRIGLFKDSDEKLINGMKQYHISFSDSITMTLQNMFHEMSRYDGKLHMALDNLSALSLKLEEFYKNMHAHDSDDIKFPDLILADKNVKGQLSTYSRETLLEQLTRMQEREAYFLDILNTLRLNFKEVKQKLEAADAVEMDLRENIEKTTQELEEKVEDIKKLEEIVGIYKIKEEMQQRSLDNTKIETQECFFIAGEEKEVLDVSDFVNFEVIINPNSINKNFSVTDESFDIEGINVFTMDNEEFADAIRKEQNKYERQIEELKVKGERFATDSNEQKESIKKLEKENKQLEEENKHLEEKNEKLEEKNEKLEEKKEILEENIVKLEENILKLEENMEKLKQDYESQIKKLKDEITVQKEKLNKPSEPNTERNAARKNIKPKENNQQNAVQKPLVKKEKVSISNVIGFHFPAIVMPDEQTKSQRPNLGRYDKNSDSGDDYTKENAHQTDYNSKPGRNSVRRSDKSSERDAMQKSSERTKERSLERPSEITRERASARGNKVNGLFESTNDDSRKAENAEEKRATFAVDPRHPMGYIDPNDKDAISMKYRAFEAEDAKDVCKEDPPIGNENRPFTAHGEVNQRKLVRYHYGNEDLVYQKNGPKEDKIFVDAKLQYSKIVQKWSKSPVMRNGRPLYSKKYRERMAKIAAARAGYNPNLPHVKVSVVSVGLTNRRYRGHDLLRITPLPSLRTRVMGSIHPKDNPDLSLIVSSAKFK